jgi:hypothetical protein
MNTTIITAESVIAVIAFTVALLPVYFTIRRHERVKGLTIKMQFIEMGLAVLTGMAIMVVGKIVSLLAL